MGDPNRAAQDPIFWLHHANIDRLWQLWLAKGEGRSNPVANAVWMDTRFQMIDRYKNPIEVATREILDPRVQLGYCYESPEFLPVEILPIESIVRRQASALTLAPVEQSALSTNESPIHLGPDPVKVVMSLTSSARVLEVAGDAYQETRVVLRIDSIRYDKPPGVIYEIYLNLTPGQEPDTKGIHYIGSLTFFARRFHDTEDSTTFSSTQAFDISEAINALVEHESWTPDALTVTFVERGLIPPGSNTPETHPGLKARFGRISILVEAPRLD